jgi:hypothetical protein
MKSIRYWLVLAGVALLLLACNDEPSDSQNVQVNPGPVLTRINQNGQPLLEFVYDLERRLIRTNYYSSNGSLSMYTIYEYGAGGIKESRRYSVTYHVMNYRIVFTNDNAGRAVSAVMYGLITNDSWLVTNTVYSYDETGRILGREVTKEGKGLIGEEFAYSTNQITRQTILNPGEDDEYLQQTGEYVSGTQAMPTHWDAFVFLLYTGGNYDYVLEMFGTSNRARHWWSSGSLAIDTWTTATEQEYNSAGYPTRLTLIRENLLEDEPDEVVEMTYEYSE